MEVFSEIMARAAERKGGEAALQDLLPTVLSNEEIAEHTDAQVLSEFAKKIFQSGFVWRVVENKWPAFEEAFFGFEPHKVAMLSPEQLAARASDKNLIRHAKKMQAVYDNAVFLLDIQRQHQSAAQWIAQWPNGDIIGLWSVLKKQGSRLGGNTGPYALRALGKDSFLVNQDASDYFISRNMLDTKPGTQKALKQMQAAFNQWHQETGLPYAHLSRILACSLGENRI
ncbi:DNA-3-methyladenine glycosylase I [Paraferrimonas sedimenticola]|uniref:3-methyladenine DNA glycosylase n=1 Tax=Paraferrimonas sedimenticola TaxID=375674 RepID=A0AA37RXJ1_9GAMM|nr:DNA-3-methyladenine glycosylase I [Paraferrimonas sedimenticola]GLP97565.1 3-methyladenine DNA glycosylase [Paraferrimonas sedimenticola]